MRVMMAGAERVLHPRDDVRGVQVCGGDGARDAGWQPAARGGPHGHERALLAVARRLSRHRRKRAPRHQPHTVSKPSSHCSTEVTTNWHIFLCRTAQCVEVFLAGL